MSKYPGSKRQLKALPPAVGGQWRQPVHRASHLGLKCLGLLLLASASVLSTTEEWKPKRAPQTGEGDPQPPGKVRAAVCFYGLTRSLQWTLPSIRGRLFDALRHEGMEVDVFVHTYHLLEVRCESFESTCRNDARIICNRRKTKNHATKPKRVRCVLSNSICRAVNHLYATCILSSSRSNRRFVHDKNVHRFWCSAVTQTMLFHLGSHTD